MRAAATYAVTRVKPHLPAERPAARAFATTESETGDPHNRKYDGCNPQQVNGKSCAEKNQHQNSQQKYEHHHSYFQVRELNALIQPADG